MNAVDDEFSRQAMMASRLTEASYYGMPFLRSWSEGFSLTKGRFVTFFRDYASTGIAEFCRRLEFLFYADRHALQKKHPEWRSEYDYPIHLQRPNPWYGVYVDHPIRGPQEQDPRVHLDLEKDEKKGKWHILSVTFQFPDFTGCTIPQCLIWFAIEAIGIVQSQKDCWQDFYKKLDMVASLPGEKLDSVRRHARALQKCDFNKLLKDE